MKSVEAENHPNREGTPSPVSVPTPDLASQREELKTLLGSLGLSAHWSALEQHGHDTIAHLSIAPASWLVGIGFEPEHAEDLIRNVDDIIRMKAKAFVANLDSALLGC
uniref:SAM domain-containing protein n=1 Tax=Lotharella oceanica TaxID=641309 RepID=A0A7S2TGN4_9EUKA